MEKLILGDCIETLRSIPDGSVDLVLTDPPYNIGVTTRKNGKKEKNAWDQIEGYLPWCMEWLKELERVLKPGGVMYLWHNQILTIAELLRMIQEETSFSLRSFCVWDKGDGYRTFAWKNRTPDCGTAPRKWFPVCEYCLHFFKREDKKTGKKESRYTHHCDADHRDIWHEPMVPTSGRLHICQKPIKILRRLIRVSSNPGEMVLDCFMGSGSTGVAALLEGRDFIGIEKEPGYYTKAQEWIEQTRADIEQRALFRGI